MNHPYLVLVPADGYTACYINVKRGRGRSARRDLLSVVRVPIALRPDTLPDVLEAIAEELRPARLP